MIYCRFQVSWYAGKENPVLPLEDYLALWELLNRVDQNPPTETPTYINEEFIADPLDVQAARLEARGFRVEIRKFSNNLWIGGLGSPRPHDR